MRIVAYGDIPDCCRGCQYEINAVKAISSDQPNGVTWRLAHSCENRFTCARILLSAQKISRQKGE